MNTRRLDTKTTTTVLSILSTPLYPTTPAAASRGYLATGPAVPVSVCCYSIVVRSVPFCGIFISSFIWRVLIGWIGAFGRNRYKRNGKYVIISPFLVLLGLELIFYRQLA